MTPYIDITLLVLALIGIGLSSYAVLNFTRLTPDDKRVLRKTCRFYEDVGVYLAGFSSKPDVIADDLKQIDKLKEKIK